jgi:hypothetical protein
VRVLPLSEAVIVAFLVVVTTEVRTVNVMLLRPIGTLTPPAATRASGILELRPTLTIARAVADSRTVPMELAPPVTEGGLNVRLLSR